MTGFFPASEAVSKQTIQSLLPKCGACGLDKQCNSPKMPVTGEGRQGILIVGEAPGHEEDQQNSQFVGRAGQVLRNALYKFGFDLDRDCWKTNSLICRPQDNRTPTSAEIDYCRPNLTKTINTLKPLLIIPLGAVAVRSVLGPYWRENVGSMTQWAGWRIPLQAGNVWVAPNYHPSYVLHTEEDNNGAVVKIWFERYLERALELQGRPWAIVPNFEAHVRIVEDPYAAADWIRQKLQDGGVFAFDYETNCLKPDRTEARIVSCAICWNAIETIAYPWVGEAVLATVEFLASRYPKIGANNKFEDRWSRAKLNTPVNNFVWDCVLDAHVLDNREGITSVKFQSFARVGQSPWNDAVEPFLASVDGTGNGLNRIHEVKLNTLLRYNGMDALMEFLVAKDQKHEYALTTF